MLKTIALVLGCSTAAAFAAVTYVGRTVISSPFQMDIPYGSGLKVAQDPANVWSWHHEWVNTPNGTPATADVLVDMDGNGIMDTEHSWARVMITDLEIVSPGNQLAMVTISDGTGKRYSVGTGSYQGSSPVDHVALATPIALPVGSSLRVTLDPMGSGTYGTYEVNLIGRVVNL